MLKRKVLGISFFELMVVLLIIGILAGVSAPIYSSYLIRSRFTEVFGTINQFKDDLAVAYVDNDEFPSSFAGLTDGAYNSISSSVIKLIYYDRSTDNQDAYLNVYTYDLGVDGYVEPDSGGASGVATRITLAAITVGTGHLQFYCGQWDGSAQDVPLAQLPNSCQDTNISALIS